MTIYPNSHRIGGPYHGNNNNPIAMTGTMHQNDVLDNENFAADLNKASMNNVQSTLSECASCRKPIRERFLLKALDQLWHEDCLKCACCDCRLGEVGSTLFTKANLILCKRDYLR